ncbi:pentatricopeptide repeat-containing protein At5g08510-like [Curcuma longa]|uniref:pentatricopeptide repeat-containing protein At5g08510-like n=1 Tax=Curcuma longa TaxID=136217 RepID=UPI003D9FA3EF
MQTSEKDDTGKEPTGSMHLRYQELRKNISGFVIEIYTEGKIAYSDFPPSTSRMIDAPLPRDPRSLVRLIKSVIVAAASPFPRTLQKLHSHVRKLGLLSNDFVSSALISSLAAFGFVHLSRQLYDEIPQPGLVPRTAMARAYSTDGQPEKTLLIFRALLVSGLSPDPIALSTAISACHQSGSLSIAETIHGYIISSGIVVDSFVTTELIKVYGYHGKLGICQRLFDEMPVRTIVSSNTLLHQYVKHGDVDSACRLFAEMTERDVVSWNTLISGFSQLGRSREALAFFRQMTFSSEKANKLTFSIILSACASIGALNTGIWLHAYLGSSILNSDGSLDHCLIDMYAKCGSIEKAMQVFESKPVRRDLYSWTSAICGLAMHGRAGHALRLFSQMMQMGIKPDDVTLVGVLNACAHGGLVELGFKLFSCMEGMYGLAPKIEHYGCVIDLLGRAGRLREAYDTILKMPMKPNTVLWGILLSVCKVHNNVELAEIAAMNLIELDPYDPWARVMLSNIYAEIGDWGGVMRLRKEMHSVGLKKTPGCSSIEISGEIYEFLVGDSLHPQIEEILEILEIIEAHMQVH